MISIMLDDKIYTCPFCGKSNFKRKGDLTQHIKYCKENPNRIEHHCKGKPGANLGWKMKESTKEKLRQANLGKKITKETREKLKRYAKRDKSLNLKCRYCGKDNFHAEIDLKNHERSCKMNPNRKIKIHEEIYCKYCGRMFNSKCGCTSHMKYCKENPDRVEHFNKNNIISEETAKKISASLKGRRSPMKGRVFTKEENEIIQNKIYKSKKNNNSFKRSNLERDIKNFLIENNIEYIDQYRSNLYPYLCDFYLPFYDLYIEVQGYMSHGSMPYDENNDECIKILELWKKRSKTNYIDSRGNFKARNQYVNWIYNWTVKDVEKRNCAINNKINFIEIFSNNLDECKNIILKSIGLH